MKTFSAKPSDVAAKWHVIDATGQRLGRLATRVAQVLQGKHRAIYTPHVLTGDFVVVVNARKLDVSSRKGRGEVYYRHTGYPGGLRAVPLEDMMERHPDRVVQRAVKNMLPGNTLARQMLKRLKVYGGETHPHEAQVNAGTGARSRKPAPQSAEGKAEARVRRPKRTAETPPRAPRRPVARAPAPAAQAIETQPETPGQPGAAGSAPSTPEEKQE